MSILNSASSIALSNLSFLKGLINRNALKATSNRFYSTELENDQDEAEQKPERKFFKKPEIIDGFEVFDVYMNKKSDTQLKKNLTEYVKKDKDILARSNRMSTDQDWTNAWPTATSFKQSAVPLPLRQGYIKSSCENSGLPPTSYGNAELIKIPNFFHLTPPHIKKHCEAIKKFCTPWPVELKDAKTCIEHFPVRTTTSTYIYDGPSLRDDRARVVTLRVNVNSLGLDKRSEEKFIKLAEHRFNPRSGVVTIVADKCPYRRQNEDYANYLLTTLYYESQNVEDWESEMTEDDRIAFVWEESKSKDNLLSALGVSVSQADVLKKSKIQEYGVSVSRLFRRDLGGSRGVSGRRESRNRFNDYKEAAMKVLELKSIQNL